MVWDRGCLNDVSPISPSGRQAIVAGSTFGDEGDGLPAIAAKMISPVGLAVDARGGFFVVDSNAHRVRYVSPDGVISAAVSQSGNAQGIAGDRGPAAAAQLHAPFRVAVAPDGSLYVTDIGDHSAGGNQEQKRKTPRLRRIRSPFPGFAAVTDILKFYTSCESVESGLRLMAKRNNRRCQLGAKRVQLGRTSLAD